MESTSQLLSAYTSIAAAVMVSRTMVEHVNPKPMLGSIRSYFNPKQTMKFEELNEVGDRNQLYNEVEHYLRDKIDAHTERIRATKTSKKKIIGFALDDDQEIVDRFDNFFVQWRYVVVEAKEKEDRVKRYYELIYPKKHHERVKKSYLEQVKAVAKDVENKEKVLKIYTIRSDVQFRKYRFWESTILEHSSTFETLAMEPAEKKRIRDDLDLFTKRKEFYKNAGKAWKRGYLLYGPPGTGKSSLIAAMANYLQYKVYDLELTSIANNSELRKALLSTKNRSIVVVEDIDCSLEIQNRDKENHDESDSDDEYPKKKKKSDKEKVTLSGLLNFVDGLWSSCGEQRIFVFTTNYKDKLDPALLRPGRMDVHIHMSYCTPCGFRILAQNYLQIEESSPHHLFSEIEDLIQSMEVTPAQVAGELQLSPDADVSLSGLVHFLKNLKKENEKKKKEKEEQEKKKKEAEAEHKKLMKKMLKFCWKKREIT